MKTFSWTFSNLMVHPFEGDLSDVMVTINYRFSVFNGTSTRYIKGVCEFAPPDPKQFVELSSIDEKAMIEIVTKTLGKKVSEMEAELDSQLANPTIEKPLPWTVVDNGVPIGNYLS